MRIIITGVAGFIGSNICEKLLELNHEIIGIDNFICGYKENILHFNSHPKFTFFELSIEDKELYSIIQKDDIIIHLAAISSLASNQENPVFSYNNNICGMINLLEISRINGVKHFIFASTSAIYENNNEFPLHESLQTNPDLIYSVGKKHGEELLISFHKTYGLNYSILRFFNVYGPRQDFMRTHPALIPYIIDSFKNNKIPILHSDGNQERDYVFIDDIIHLFIILIKKHPINDIINVSSGKTISVKNIVTIINSYLSENKINPVYRDPSLLWEKSEKLWRGNYPFSKDRMKQEVNKYTLGDSIKAKNILDWEAKTDMKEGLLKCITFEK